MPDDTRTMGPDDLRAAVAAGILTEAQAAGLMALAQGRAGQRAHMAADDEPFEFFRGFSEIFIALGLKIRLYWIDFIHFISITQTLCALSLSRPPLREFPPPGA